MQSCSYIVKIPSYNYIIIFGKITKLFDLLLRWFDFHSLFIYSQFRLNFVCPSPKRKWKRGGEKDLKNHEQNGKGEPGLIIVYFGK